jgi:MFS family permease
VLVTGAALFVLASLGQAVAGNWAGFLALRFLAGVVGSPPISIFGGVIADLYEGEVVRGRVMMYWYVCLAPVCLFRFSFVSFSFLFSLIWALILSFFEY